MRENRPSGSEGGGTEIQSVLPTPIFSWPPQHSPDFFPKIWPGGLVCDNVAGVHLDDWRQGCARGLLDAPGKGKMGDPIKVSRKYV